MHRVCQINSSARPPSPRRGLGQPPKKTPEGITAFHRTIDRAALTGGEMPRTLLLGEAQRVSEHTLRNIRWHTLLLNPRDIAGWQQQGAQATEAPGSTAPELVRKTPFAACESGRDRAYSA